MYQQSSTSVPTAHLCINKSRIKIYQTTGKMPTYYLEKGSEFSIELHNPTTQPVLAKISLNGKLITQGGLVLNPAQRVYLERYIDVARKFKFDTYEVTNSAANIKAIQENGDFKVEFYRESTPLPIYTPTYITRGYYDNIQNQYLNNTGSPINLMGTTTCSLGSGNITTMGLTSSSVSFDSGILRSNATMDSMNNASLSDEAPKVRSRKLLSKSVETGRVEMGSTSSQKLETISKSFEYSSFHTIEYKMLPLSQKINTIEDIQVKRYCTQCGKKSKQLDVFCSQCGKKL